MIKGLGRIILVVVGIFMLAVGIWYLAGVTWSVGEISTILYGLVLVLAGLSAAFAGLKGEGGFWFTIFSLVMIALVVYYGIVNKDNFSPFSWEYLGKFILSLLAQILYALGFIFLKIGQ